MHIIFCTLDLLVNNSIIVLRLHFEVLLNEGTYQLMFLYNYHVKARYCKLVKFWENVYSVGSDDI